MQMGHGNPATLRLLAVGVRPSISIDIVTSIGGDMFSCMRVLLAATRAVVNGKAIKQGRIVDPLPLTARDMLDFATLQGAQACGLAGKIGSLTPGKQADVVLVDTKASTCSRSTMRTAPWSRPPMPATSTRSSSGAAS